jgi:GNAT superfamily N-acetyltransferase
LDVGRGEVPLEPIAAWSEADVDDLHALYRGEWWSAGRTRDEVRRMLDGANVVVGLRDRRTERLAAFARVVTDGVFKATVYDVIVAPEYRGLGAGKALMEAVLGHRDLHGVRHVELYCLPELVPFYRRYGFSEEVGGVVLMRRENA